jgi:hypothetical protein
MVQKRAYWIRKRKSLSLYNSSFSSSFPIRAQIIFRVFDLGEDSQKFGYKIHKLLNIIFNLSKCQSGSKNKRSHL